MRKKKVFDKDLALYILPVLVLVFASCTPTNEAPQETGPYGTAGVVLTLEPVKNTYYTVGNSIPFSFFLRIQNKGYYDIVMNDLKFSITGFDKEIVRVDGIDSQIKDFGDLYSKRTYRSEGANYLCALEGESAFDDNPLTDFEYNVNFLLRYCYKYKTIATANVCINTNTGMYDSGCVPETVTFTGGQGAPVEFLSVSPIQSGTDYSFEIKLKNSGTGAVFNPETSLEGNNCEKLDSTLANYGKLKVSAKFSDNEIAKCFPEVIDISQGEASVRCTFNSLNGQYIRLLNLQADYIYADSASLPITFKYFKQKQN